MAACFSCVFKHRHILGTADYEIIDIAERRRFMHAVLGRFLLAGRVRHPYAPATGAATEGIVAVARHFHKLAADQFEHPARFIIIAVEAAQMTGVVQRYAPFERRGDLEPAIFQHGGENRAVMIDRRGFGEVGIFIADGVVAVRIGGHHAGKRLCRRHGGLVMLDQTLEQSFLAGAAYIIAGAALTLAQNSEIHPGGLEQSRHGLRNRLVARIERGVIADKPEIVRRFLADIFDWEF